MNSYRYQSNTMNDSHKERRNSKWNVEMHGFLIQMQKIKNWQTGNEGSLFASSLVTPFNYGISFKLKL